mmetsp:Transcript_13376/g.16977  ORF Transcript_13376/g.16977 Transcript_13376/m.16977 type:complete len:100 (+) Transcript_13376:12-311(+)
MLLGLIWTYLVVPLAYVIGSIKLFFVVFELLVMLNKRKFRTRMDHLKRYGGKGTWALVTGASDGIGLEFCKQLARSGFNICLVSRAESKMKTVVENDLV